MARIILYRCESCETGFGLLESYEKNFPHCPTCGNDETLGTGELIEGSIVPDKRDW